MPVSRRRFDYGIPHQIMSTGDFDIKWLVEQEVRDSLEKLLKEKEYALYMDGMSNMKQKPLSATQVQIQQQQMLMQYQQLANGVNAQIIQQKLLNHFGMGTQATPAGPPPLPYKCHDIGEYQIVRENGHWSLRHKPCIRTSPHSMAISKSSSRPEKKVHTVDEDGVCDGCGGVADESMLMQLKLRSFER